MMKVTTKTQSTSGSEMVSKSSYHDVEELEHIQKEINRIAKLQIDMGKEKVFVSKSKFSVGDRVRVYDGHKSFTGEVKEIREDGTGLLYVMEDGFYSYPENAPFHPKQCRLLKEKTRRELWVQVGDLNMITLQNDRMLNLVHWESPSDTSGWIKFIECKKEGK